MEKQRIVDNLESFGEFFSKSLNIHLGKGDATNELEREAAETIHTASQYNAWFTAESVARSYQAWSDSLKREKIEKWLSEYELENSSPKKVGVIMAGNIPMVGLHDALSVLVTGHQLMAKLSSKDNRLMDLCLRVLATIDCNWKENISKVERLNDADMLIATGNDNSARYFEYYFRETPKIIRKNRTSVGVLSEGIEQESLDGLAEDVFTYFGLGCRNVTKVYIPKDFDLDKIFGSFFKYKELINHHQYANNYDYNKAVYLMNRVELRENGFILLKEDEGLHSPLGVLFYERYDDLEKVNARLQQEEDQIQAIVSDLEGYKNLGEAQKPELWEYADNIDTIKFLLEN